MIQQLNMVRMQSTYQPNLQIKCTCSHRNDMCIQMPEQLNADRANRQLLFAVKMKTEWHEL